MELDILQLDALALAAAGGLEEHLVVEPQPQLGHAGQVHSHLDVAADLGPVMLVNIYCLCFVIIRIVSDLSTLPCAPASRSTLSITSRNTSFLRYLIPSGSLQDTALVTAGGGLGAPSSSLYPSWVMYSCNDRWH